MGLRARVSERSECARDESAGERSACRELSRAWSGCSTSSRAESTIWPGHDFGCRPCSTLARETATNPFLRCDGLAAFLDLKRRWPSFEEKHGLV